MNGPGDLTVGRAGPNPNRAATAGAWNNPSRMPVGKDEHREEVGDQLQPV